MAERRMMRRTFSGAGAAGRVMGAHTLWLLQGSPYVSGHYLCHVCWEQGSGPLYHCPDCQLDFHVGCVAGTGGGHVAQTHFSHFQHPLHLKSVGSSSGDEVVCDGCGESHRGSNSSVYRCSHCDFDLCPLCVRAPRFLLHSSHPHILVLSSLDELGSACQCDGCGQSAKGMMYRCTCCNFDLHMSCIRLPLKPILAAIHPDHPLTLIFQDDDAWTSSYSCNACGLEGRGWAYTCSICRFYVHPDCGKVIHDTPRTSSNSNGIGHLRNIDPKVTQRANFPQKSYNNFHNPYSVGMNSPSMHTHGGSSRFLNRSYSSSSAYNERLSPYPYGSHSYSNTSLDRFRHGGYSSPRTYGDNWNATSLSSNALVEALSNRITPMSPRDVDAVDRVMGMLRQNGSPPY